MEYRYFGLLAFIILITGLIFVIFKWPAGKHLTFSQHVALQKQSIIYYVALFSITLPLLLLFLVGWFQPTFQLSPWFNVFIVLSSIGQLLATIVPETTGWKVKFHRFISGMSGVLLIPMLVLMLSSEQISIVGKIITLLGIITMASVIGVLMINKKRLLLLHIFINPSITPRFLYQFLLLATCNIGVPRRTRAHVKRHGVYAQ